MPTRVRIRLAGLVTGITIPYRILDLDVVRT